MKTQFVSNRLALGLSLAALALGATSASASHGRVTAQAEVRVWIEGGDVFSNYSDVAIWLRPERDCYTTLFMVDTDGYMHVLYPNASFDDTWLYGGRSYCYRARDLGLDRIDGAGIAYVFAVGSPVPFDYSVYGAGVFVGSFGFRVYGDPFVACRDFYMTLLPASCRWDFVGVSYARFYVRHWQRYPSYLCHRGHGVHVRVGDACRSCEDVYISYRDNCARPWNAFHPAPKFKAVHAEDGPRDARVGHVERAQGGKFKSVERNDVREYAAREMEKPSNRNAESTVAKTRAKTVRAEYRAQSAPRTKSSERARVVSTSSARERASVDKANVAAMRSHASKAGKVEHPRDSSKRDVVTRTEKSRTDTREKGSKKKQAR